MRDHNQQAARWVGGLAILVLAAGCGGDKSGGSGGITHDPKASGATTATVTQKTGAKLPDGTLVISVFAGRGATPQVAEMDGVLYASDQGWYVFSVHPAGQGGTPSGGREVFLTPSLPSLPLNDQNLTLQRVDLKADGRSRAHRSGGVEVILAIQGKIEVHSGTFSPRQLTSGQGSYVLDNTPLQVWSLGGPASYLDFYLLPNGRALSTDFQFSP